MMRALSIRQPYAELILRGIKRIEYRTIATRKIGERFYIYAAKKPARESGFTAEAQGTQRGMKGLDRKTGRGPALTQAEFQRLPRGMLVGTAVISRCTPGKRLPPADRRPLTAGLYEWHLTDVKRLKHPRKPTGSPQPVWFNPFPTTRPRADRPPQRAG